MPDSLPKNVEVLILGGGIHGVGVLHDLLSRGIEKVHLIERTSLAAGTSSKSTKLIHGGIRYLRHPRQFRMVYESLRERRFLLNVANDIVKPIELLIPIFRRSFFTRCTLKAGLLLYDFLARKHQIKRHRFMPLSELAKKMPFLDIQNAVGAYSFWDAQTDDLLLVKRVADSAQALGAKLSLGCQVEKMQEFDGGWKVSVRDKKGQRHSIKARCIVNCLGPWSHDFLQNSEIIPKYEGVNNKGVHLVVRDLGLKAGLFLPSGEQNRFVFVLPWKGYTLIGTTESAHLGDPDSACVKKEDMSYLLDLCGRFFKIKLTQDDIVTSFAGLRWLALEGGSGSLSSLSREHVVSEHELGSVLLLTIYGGKLTSYRSLAEKIGDRISSHLGVSCPSRTSDHALWLKTSKVSGVEPSVVERFEG